MNGQKNRKTTLILIILAIFLAAGIFFIMPSIRFTKERVLEKDVIYRAEDFILSSNGSVTPERNTLYTNEIGIQSFHFSVKKGIFSRDVVFSYEVVDTTPPVITIGNGTVQKEIGEAYDLEDMKRNIAVNEGSFTLETDYDPAFPGIYRVDIEAVDDYGNKSSAFYEVIVIDREEPVVFRSGNGARILKGSDFDIMDIISYGDNADPEPMLEVAGRVNTSREGSYPLHVKVTDASGNRTEWTLSIQVVDDIPWEEPDDYSYPFEQFKEEYAKEGRKLGIDVSEWQDEIDFEAIKEAGCEFVIMRIGFSHEGKLTMDKQFERNIKGCKEAGLPVGIYLFSYDNTEEYLLQTMEQMFAALGDTQLELPIVFDWENFDHFQSYHMSFKDLEHLYNVFEREVTARGYQSMLYGSKYYLNLVWPHADRHPIWLAQYSDWPSYEKDYQIWQVLDWGQIDGIDWYADFDILFTD
jgi:GH25 family lysozyme M1 (1,4-beta-N-acetylmuramidase)